MKGVIIITIFWMFSGCSPRYASVYVNTIDKQTNQSVSSKLYSGKSGLFIGITPLNIPLEILKKERQNYAMSLIAREDCYYLKWELVVIENWAKTRDGSMKPTNQNNIRLELSKKSECSD